MSFILEMNEKTFFILAHSFQGIDHLDFRPDKFGNQDIVGMVSAQVTLGSKEGKEQITKNIRTR